MLHHSIISCRFAVLAITAAMFIPASPSWAASAIGAVEKIKAYAYGTLEGGKKDALFQNDNVFIQELVETVTMPLPERRTAPPRLLAELPVKVQSLIARLPTPDP